MSNSFVNSSTLRVKSTLNHCFKSQIHWVSVFRKDPTLPNLFPWKSGNSRAFSAFSISFPRFSHGQPARCGSCRTAARWSASATWARRTSRAPHGHGRPMAARSGVRWGRNWMGRSEEFMHQWNPMNFHDFFLWNPMKFHEIPWTSPCFWPSEIFWLVVSGVFGWDYEPNVIWRW